MSKENVNIALAGFGNIGAYFYKVLNQNKNILFRKTGKIPIIKYISVKNIKKKRKIKIPENKCIRNSINISNYI